MPDSAGDAHTSTAKAEAEAEAVMARVLIRCPVTRAPVDTGVHVDAEGFRFVSMVLASVPQTLRCPACDQEHVWKARDAFLEPSDGRQ